MLAPTQCGKTWIQVLGICVLVALYLLHAYHSQSTLKDHVVPTRRLLSDTEDDSKLWFPGRGDQGLFIPLSRELDRSARRSDPPQAPLLIGFTRNNDMIVQTVVSFLAAGWPREDIIVVDNSGSMDANPRALLSRQNPFFLDYPLLRMHYGVNVLQTPTLLSFSQLQNFFLRLAMSHGWQYYFTAHMDVVVMSDEALDPYRSLFDRVIDVLADLGVHGQDDLQAVRLTEDWAVKFFAYDWLTLVNVQSWRTIGAWDTFIPYYHSDCDAYSRARRRNYSLDQLDVGLIYDVAVALPETMFFPEANEVLNSSRHRHLRAELETLMMAKNNGDRNTWQAQQGDVSRGEAWTYDPKGFDKAWRKMDDVGRSWFQEKWGTLKCDLDMVAH